MIVNNSQTIQTSNPLDTTSARRVNTSGASSSTTSNKDKSAEQAQQLQIDGVLRELRARDREVRAHEAAHIAAGGSLVLSGPSFTLQRGPDGRSYAIGGEVQLDVSAVSNDPEATLSKADQVRKAALAPADPSTQDIRVAANASQMAARARVDIAIMRREEAQLTQDVSQLAQTQDKQANTEADSSASIAVNQSEEIQPAVSANTSSLQSSEPPAAAISAFMATAQSEPVPVRFNQFA